MQSNVRCNLPSKYPFVVYIQTSPQLLPIRSHDDHRRLHSTQLSLAQSRAINQQHGRLVTSATTYPKPSNNIFKRVEQDLLPDGAPNTSWRRLLARINTTQNVSDLQRIWSTFHPKTSIWRPAHEAAVITKAVALSYPAALLIPEQYVSWLPAPDPTANDKSSNRWASLRQQTAMGNKQDRVPIAQAYPDSMQPTANKRFQTITLPAGLSSIPYDLQRFLDVANLTTIDAEALESMNGTTIARLLVCCTRLGCRLSDGLQSDLLGELFRNGGQKLLTLPIDLLAQLTTAMLSVQPPTHNISAAVSGDFDVEDNSYVYNLQLQPPILLPATAATYVHHSRYTHRHQRTNAQLPEVRLSTPSRGQETDASNTLDRTSQTLTFQEFLQTYSAVPPPVEPLYKTSRPTSSPADKPRAYRLSSTAIWLGLARAAMTAVSHRKSKQAVISHTLDICMLASALAHAGCLGPNLCDSILETLLKPAHLQSMSEHASRDLTISPDRKHHLSLIDLQQCITVQEVDMLWSRTLTDLQGDAAINVTAEDESAHQHSNTQTYQPLMKHSTPKGTPHLCFEHVRFSRLPYNPGVLADLAVTLTLCELNRNGHASTSHQTTMQPTDWLLGAGGVLHRFLMLLPEATLDDITRVSWALGQLYSKRYGRLTTNASMSPIEPVAANNATSAKTALNHDKTTTQLSHGTSYNKLRTTDITDEQVVVQDVAICLFKHATTRKFKWTCQHLITCMEVYTNMHPVLPIECLAYFAALPLRQPSLLSISCPLATLERLAAVVASASKLALNSSPAGNQPPSQRQAGFQIPVDVGAAGSASFRELASVMSRTCSFMACILVRQLPNLSMDGLLAILRLIATARQCGVNDVVTAAPRTVLVAALLNSNSIDVFQPRIGNPDLVDKFELTDELSLPVCESELLQQVYDKLASVTVGMTPSKAAQLSQVLHESQDIATAKYFFKQTLTCWNQRP